MSMQCNRSTNGKRRTFQNVEGRDEKRFCHGWVLADEKHSISAYVRWLSHPMEFLSLVLFSLKQEPSESLTAPKDISRTYEPLKQPLLQVLRIIGRLPLVGHDSEPTESGGLVRMWRHDHLTFRPPLQLCEKFAKWVALIGILLACLRFCSQETQHVLLYNYLTLLTAMGISVLSATQPTQSQINSW
ncbi:hypothetical protein BD769DRAFT_1638938 [Suillus cothurnatus]|nr:hypothetical protein BD769DRAFT_1638938 [Suillus cothurnatus]